MANLELKTASGGSVTLVPEDGGGNFSVNIKNADGTLLLNEDFDQKLLAKHGYQVLPSGLIIQWVADDASGGSSVTTTTLPIAFPTSMLLAIPIDSGKGTNFKTYGTWDSSGSTNSQVVIGWYSSPVVFSILAIGH